MSVPYRPVLAFHVVFSTYGFWLPNDPRGSNSTSVGALHLREFGPATKTSVTRSVADRPLSPEDRERRRAAKQALLHSPVRFTPPQLDLVRAGFEDALTVTRATLLAGVVLPDHVHLVLAKHHYDIERVVGLMKGRATKALRDAGHFADAIRRDATHPGPPRLTADRAKITRDPPTSLSDGSANGPHPRHPTRNFSTRASPPPPSLCRPVRRRRPPLRLGAEGDATPPPRLPPPRVVRERFKQP